MFERPSTTLQQSLLNVLENAEEYVADVCFNTPTAVWAHKALLLARVPTEFRDKYMKELLTCSTLDLSSLVEPSLLKSLLKFWYTGELGTEEREEVKKLESKTGIVLLSGTRAHEQEQWVADLKRMIDEKLCSDVVLNIFQVKQPQPGQEFPAHRFILAGGSDYFRSVFCTEFREASTSSVHLPSDLFTAESLQVILYYFYTDQLILPQGQETGLKEKRKSLRILQKVYSAASYLGHTETLCKAVLVDMQELCHDFQCLCSECAALLPFMLFFAHRHQQIELREHLTTVYANPIVHHLWSQRALAILVQRDPELIQPIRSRALENIDQENAVHVHYSLHLCLSSLRSADPVPTWSLSLLQILDPLLTFATHKIANHFDYYCVQNPVLLTCLDNLGEGFSVDFLGFVLTHVLTQGIHKENALAIYQGLVRDLGRRQAVVKNVAVDGVLATARTRCSQFIGSQWASIKGLQGFQSLDRDVLKELSEDINVPIKTLTKPVETSGTLFGFKPKKTKQEISFKRLSIQESDLEEPKPRERRARSSSTTTATTNTPSILKKAPEERPFQKKRQGSQASLTDALLSEHDPAAAPPRQSRLKFALPDTPSRPHRATIQQQKAKAKAPRNKIRWSLGYSTSDSSDDDGPSAVVPQIGQKVELLRRPLPTMGTIKYIGPVDFSKGTLVGIELESRVGNNDGSVDGKRYFQTFPQRGVFVKMDDFKIVTKQ